MCTGVHSTDQETRNQHIHTALNVGWNPEESDVLPPSKHERKRQTVEKALKSVPPRDIHKNSTNKKVTSKEGDRALLRSLPRNENFSPLVANLDIIPLTLKQNGAL